MHARALGDRANEECGELTRRGPRCAGQAAGQPQPKAKELVQGLLQHDPIKRLSAAQVLESAWLQVRRVPLPPFPTRVGPLATHG